MEFLEQLISAVEQDETEQPGRDLLMQNIYASLENPGLDSWAGDFILTNIDTYMTLWGFVAARAALLDYHLEDYECRQEEAMRSDRTFGE